MKILMIEDNRSVCEMMSMFFKKESGTPLLLTMVRKPWKSLRPKPTTGKWCS